MNNGSFYRLVRCILMHCSRKQSRITSSTKTFIISTEGGGGWGLRTGSSPELPFHWFFQMTECLIALYQSPSSLKPFFRILQVPLFCCKFRHMSADAVSTKDLSVLGPCSLNVSQCHKTVFCLRKVRYTSTNVVYIMQPKKILILEPILSAYKLRL